MLGIAIERPSFYDKSVGGLGGKRNARDITRHARLEPGSGIDVASLEEHQYSYTEYYSVPESTARQISQICADGGRGGAIGPIVVRAVESAANCDWTDKRRRRLDTAGDRRGSWEGKAIDLLITGFHEPRASHLHMLRALAGHQHLGRAFEDALAA